MDFQVLFCVKRFLYSICIDHQTLYNKEKVFNKGGGIERGAS